ncbi:MAG: hypothetical protein OER95_03525 [Acidimicrobiia bacterium]|nr:hypothetical protein [Acidimicrobiia bacterium]
MILAHAGHRIDKTDQPGCRFPAGRVGSVYRRVYMYLLERRPAGVVSAAASGADLVVLRAAEDLFIPFHIALPLPIDEFRRRSVDDRGADWSEAFDRAITRASAVVVADGLLDHDDWFRRGNDFILDTAADLAVNGKTGITAGGVGHRPSIEALAIVTSTPAAAGSTTADFFAKARRRGWPVHTIDPLTD